ncbi:MAG: arginine--tRNA ligase, partial [Candidatus Nanohaloarchaea archaeon]
HKIEKGEDEAVRLWKKFRQATIKHDKKEYQRMNITFDRWTGESKIAEKTQEMIEKGLEEGIFKEDEDGSIYVEF